MPFASASVVTADALTENTADAIPNNVQEPITRKWVNLAKTADKVNPEIRKKLAAEVMVVCKAVADSLEVQQLNPGDAEFLNRLGTGGAKAIKILWAAQDHLQQLAKRAIAETL